MAERGSTKPKTTERELTRFATELFKWAERLHPGFCWYRNHQTLGCRPGRPDFELIVDGRFYGLELKSPGGRGKLSPAQEEERERIQRAGAMFFVCTNPEDVIAVLNQLGLKRISLKEVKT